MCSMALRINLIRGWPLPRIWSRSLKTWSTSSDDYNFLEKSDLPTDHYQSSLPLLPIPRLDDSCRRYLTALRPLIADDAQYAKTVDIVGSFNIGIGQQLQNKLIEKNRALRHTSYIADDWNDSYLSSRLPLPLNFNVNLVLLDDVNPNYNQPCIKATNYLISCLRYRRSFNENVLAPDVARSSKSSDDEGNITPFDMSQHQYLFGSTRIPALNLDFLQDFPDSKHVVVLKDGKFYCFNALDDCGSLKSPEYIYSCIKYIWDKKDNHIDSNNISWLTCLPRDDWARARTHLIENPTNAANLVLIDSALTLICLDTEVDYDGEREDKASTLYGHNFLHGCRLPDLNSNNDLPLNRWFDKSFSTIFTKNGIASINFEHSWGDGRTLTRFHDRVYDDYTRHHFVSPETAYNRKVGGDIKPISFQVEECIRKDIEEGKRIHKEATSNLDMNYLVNREMNRKYLKSKKLSPDSIFQLSFQMAYFKVSSGVTPTTYESCSTAHFKHGRTETIRAATLSTQKACNMFHVSRNKHSLSDLRAVINECSQTHSKLAKEASQGEGFDRHWFALKNIAEKQGMKDVSIFKDQSYQHANHFTLSTSSLFAGKIFGGSFGPVVANGFGLGYGYQHNDLAVYCTNWKDSRNGPEFIEALKESMNDIHSTIEST